MFHLSTALSVRKGFVSLRLDRGYQWGNKTFISWHKLCIFRRQEFYLYKASFSIFYNITLLHYYFTLHLPDQLNLNLPFALYVVLPNMIEHRSWTWNCHLHYMLSHLIWYNLKLNLNLSFTLYVVVLNMISHFNPKPKSIHLIKWTWTGRKGMLCWCVLAIGTLAVGVFQRPHYCSQIDSIS